MTAVTSDRMGPSGLKRGFRRRWGYGGYDGKAGCPSVLRLGRRLVDQHDRYVIFHRIDAVAPLALEGLRLLSIFQGLFTGWTDQHLQQAFINHDVSIVRHVSGRGRGSFHHETEIQRTSRTCMNLIRQGYTDSPRVDLLGVLHLFCDSVLKPARRGSQPLGSVRFSSRGREPRPGD